MAPGTISGLILAPFRSPGGALGDFLNLLGIVCRSDLFMQQKTPKHAKNLPRVVLQKEHGGTRTNFWGPGKTSHSERNIAKHQGKRHFRKIALTGAVKERGIIKG